MKEVDDTEEASSLKRERPALQNMEFLNFSLICGSFLSSWIRIQHTKMNADPDPQPLINFFSKLGQRVRNLMHYATETYADML
jgi:hypothetical protein